LLLSGFSRVLTALAFAETLKLDKELVRLDVLLELLELGLLKVLELLELGLLKMPVPDLTSLSGTDLRDLLPNAAATELVFREQSSSTVNVILFIAAMVAIVIPSASLISIL
jgi:hypothetical protein